MAKKKRTQKRRRTANSPTGSPAPMLKDGARTIGNTVKMGEKGMRAAVRGFKRTFK